jgi:hypothetical protein
LDKPTETDKQTEDALLTIERAANLLGVSKTAIRRLTHIGRLTCQIIEGTPIYRREHILDHRKSLLELARLFELSCELGGDVEDTPYGEQVDTRSPRDGE